MLRPYAFHIEIDPEDRSKPVYQQVYEKVHDLIVGGVLGSGDFLPSSRELSQQLGINRKSVVKAMALLQQQGLISSEDRKGLYVSLSSEESLDTESRESHMEPLVHSKPFRLDGGTPDTSTIAFMEFSRCYRQNFNKAARSHQLGYASPLGYEPLRATLSSMLSHSHGLSVTSGNIIITRGSQMALFLLSRTLLTSSQAIAIEDPGYYGAIDNFRAAGITIYPIPVDGHGLRTEDLEQTLIEHPEIGAVYLTPRYQYPTTVTLSPSRRTHLKQLCERYRFFVIEDDFGSDYRFGPNHYNPLCCMMPKDRFIYIGTFSKTFAPGIRLGFLVASEQLIPRLANLRRLMDLHGDTIIEKTMAELLEEGVIKRMLRRSYQKMSIQLSDFHRIISRDLKGLVEYSKPGGGLALWMKLPLDLEKKELLSSFLTDQGIQARIQECPDQRLGIRIGFATLTIAQMEKTTQVLRDFLISQMQ